MDLWPRHLWIGTAWTLPWTANAGGVLPCLRVTLCLDSATSGDHHVTSRRHLRAVGLDLSPPGWGWWTGATCFVPLGSTYPRWMGQPGQIQRKQLHRHICATACAPVWGWRVCRLFQVWQLLGHVRPGRRQSSALSPAGSMHSTELGAVPPSALDTWQQDLGLGPHPALHQPCRTVLSTSVNQHQRPPP